MKSEHLHIRIGKEDQKRLAHMKEHHCKKVSKLVRMAIRYAYNNPDVFSYYLEHILESED